MGSESTSSEGPTHHLPWDPSPAPFLEFHCVASDHSITFNTVYSTPGCTDMSGGSGGHHSTGSSSGGYKIEKVNHILAMNTLYVQALSVMNSMLADTVGERPNALNLAVTLTLYVLNSRRAVNSIEVTVGMVVTVGLLS